MQFKAGKGKIWELEFRWGEMQGARSESGLLCNFYFLFFYAIYSILSYFLFQQFTIYPIIFYGFCFCMYFFKTYCMNLKAIASLNL